MPDLERPASPLDIFKLSRSFETSIDRLWRAWTEPEDLAKWWGPAGMKLEIKSFDLKPGGLFHYSMIAPMGTMWGKFIYRQIKAPTGNEAGLLAYVVSFCDEDGQTLRHPLAPLWPLEVLSLQTFTPMGETTQFEGLSYPINATEQERAIFTAGHASMHIGFDGTLAQLDRYLSESQS